MEIIPGSSSTNNHHLSDSDAETRCTTKVNGSAKKASQCDSPPHAITFDLILHGDAYRRNWLLAFQGQSLPYVLLANGSRGIQIIGGGGSKRTGGFGEDHGELRALRSRLP